MKTHEKTAELCHCWISPTQFDDVQKVRAGELSSNTLCERDLLRAALAQLVGASSRAELEGLRSALSAVPASSADRAAMDAALDALLTTLPEGA